MHQVEIILRAERPFTIMRKRLEPFYFRSKARLMKLEMQAERRKK